MADRLLAVADPEVRPSARPPVGPPGPARRPTLALPTVAFLASRAVLVVLALVVPAGPGAPRGLHRLVAGNDAGWYLTIATHGYAHLPLATALHLNVQENWVFFPLFPISARLLAHLVGAPILWTGVALSNAAFWGFLVVLHRWVARDWSTTAARYAVAFAAFVPLVAYTAEFRETSVLLLLSALCLERAVHGHRLASALFGALASLTQPDAVLLVVPYLMTCWPPLRRRQGKAAGLGALALAPLFGVGGVTMAAVSARDAGTALAFLREQAAWGWRLGPPLDAFVPFLRHPAWLTWTGWASPPVALVAVAGGLLAAWYLWRRGAPGALWVYLAVVVVAATANTVVLGIPRFIAGTPPLYVAAGLAPPRARAPALVVCAAAMVAYTVCWLLGAHWTMA